MKLWIGTSGYSYPEWKGSFYPADLAQKGMFGHYAEHFRTVEINATFYRMPTDQLIAGWVKGAPAGFRFTLKVQKSITHTRRLKDCADPLAVFLDRADKLGDHRAALFFQVPPFVKKDVPLLREFVARVPRELRPAYELLDPSWHTDEVFGVLADAGAALCISDSDKQATPFEATASWGYLRLRDEGYTRKDLAKWHARITAQKWEEAFVYFKHEDAGKGADLAQKLQAIDRRAKNVPR
jgi:uncharacterized protein YecE (DUF72 family)